MSVFSIRDAALNAKNTAPSVGKLSHNDKQNVLRSLAKRLLEQKEYILNANAEDVANGQQEGLSDALIDRLRLDEMRLTAIADAVIAIAEQPDPVGRISHLDRMPSGIQVGKMRIPLGVIAMIYESRPNVTIDAAALCFKAGNAVILRGGKEALSSNLALAQCFHKALEEHGLARDVVTVIPDPERSIMAELLTLNDTIDLVIPRGGEGLIRYVSDNSKIPVIQHFNGICHLYVNKHVDLGKAIALLENGKTQRTGVCNALETLLVDNEIVEQFLPMVADLFVKHGAKVHACARSIRFFDDAVEATEADWSTEYLAMEISIKVVDGYAPAIAHIDTYGSGHTDVIVTENYAIAQSFLQDVNSAVVMVNASSRFSDGGELGLGAEIGISTSKLHAYGPMGAQSLTTEKFIVLGDGHVRA